jgi:hypothetical protein
MRETSSHHGSTLSVAASMTVCVPAFLLAAWIIETRGAPLSPSLVIPGALGMAALNFVLVVVLEQCRSRIGPFTLQALLGEIGVVMLFVIAAAINRFVGDVGFSWMMPAVLLYLALGAVAVFRERRVSLKFLLGLNALAMAALWGVGAMGKVVLPF